MNKTNLQAAAFKDIDRLVLQCPAMVEHIGQEATDEYFNALIRKILFNYYGQVRDNDLFPL